MVNKREAAKLVKERTELQVSIDELSARVHSGSMSTRDFTTEAMPMKRKIQGINIELGLEDDNADHNNMPDIVAEP